MIFRRWRTAFVLILAAGSNVFADACLKTLPPNPAFVPPAPYITNANGGFWYGTNALWTQLPLQGAWASAGSGQKFFVWSEGYDWRTAKQPVLIVTGKRLDGDAAPVAIAGGTNARIGGKYSMLIGLGFPTAGCWEVTAYHDSHALTFIVLVAP